MPKMVKIYKKKVGYRKKRMVVRRRYKRYKTIKATNSHLFRRRCEQLSVTLATGISGVQGNASAFSLGQTINNSELTTLYDSYRIIKVFVGFTFEPNNRLDASTYPNKGIQLYVKRDYDDNTAPTYGELAQSNQTKKMMLPPYKTKWISVRPAVRNIIQNSDGNPSAFKLEFTPRLDCSFPNITHYGLKYVSEWNPLLNSGGTEESPGRIRVDRMFIIQMYNTR